VCEPWGLNLERAMSTVRPGSMLRPDLVSVDRRQRPAERLTDMPCDTICLTRG
jgi:hypothetical protein